MKKHLYTLTIFLAIIGAIFFFGNSVNAAAGPCASVICLGVSSGDAECQAGAFCSSCPQCAPAPVPPAAPGALTPIVQCGGYLDDGVTRQPACTLCDLFEMISRIIRLVIIYGFAIGGMMLVVGGIMMYFGGSNPSMLSNAKSMVKNVIIGIVVMLVSFLIVFTVIHVLSGGTADTMFNLKSGGFYIECNSP